LWIHTYSPCVPLGSGNEEIAERQDGAPGVIDAGTTGIVFDGAAPTLELHAATIAALETVPAQRSIAFITRMNKDTTDPRAFPFLRTPHTEQASST
jgi:hypothetical protein